MAVSLAITLSTNDCKNLIFTETTGAYNVTTNPTGWGTPNIPLANATAASIIITTPSGASFTFVITSSGFPTTTITKQYIVNCSSLTMSGGLVDGEYTVVYNVNYLDGSGEPAIFTTTLRTYIVCNLKCCVDRMLTNINDWDCDCNKDVKEDYLTAFSIYQQILHSIECGDLTTADNNIKLANRLCKNLDCSTCK